jgi:hypothetical protein
MPPRRKKPFDWYHSEARKILAFDIRKGAVKREMSVDTVFNMRPQYAAAGKDEQEARELFEGRLDDEFRRADELTQKAAVEMAALQQDRATHPRPALDAFGRPQWEGSPAQALMRSDIKAKKHIGKTQKQFCMTRPEYQVYDAQYIGQKISQEDRKQKWIENYPKRIKSLPSDYP